MPPVAGFAREHGEINHSTEDNPLRAYWDDCGEGLPSDAAKEIDLAEARLIWSDVVRGIEGNFLGLVDENGQAIQFYYEAGIPDDIDDARHLPIVLLDLPQIDQRGSYQRQVTIGEVEKLIGAAFEHGADPKHFGNVNFVSW